MLVVDNSGPEVGRLLVLRKAILVAAVRIFTYQYPRNATKLFCCKKVVVRPKKSQVRDNTKPSLLPDRQAFARVVVLLSIALLPPILAAMSSAGGNSSCRYFPSAPPYTPLNPSRSIPSGKHSNFYDRKSRIAAFLVVPQVITMASECSLPALTVVEIILRVAFSYTSLLVDWKGSRLLR